MSHTQSSLPLWAYIPVGGQGNKQKAKYTASQVAFTTKENLSGVLWWGAFWNRVVREGFTEQVRFEPRLCNQVWGSVIIIPRLYQQTPSGRCPWLFPVSDNTTPSGFHSSQQANLLPPFTPEMMEGKNTWSQLLLPRLGALRNGLQSLFRSLQNYKVGSSQKILPNPSKVNTSCFCSFIFKRKLNINGTAWTLQNPAILLSIWQVYLSPW